MKLFQYLILLYISLLCVNSYAKKTDWTDAEIEKLKKPVVNIFVSKPFPIGFDYSIGTSAGTGFVVDKKLGFIVTNAHVVSKGPAVIEIEFFNGKKIPAKIIYFDYYHDFAILKFEPNGIVLEEAVLGSSLSLKYNEPLVLIGNNDAQGYTVKKGNSINRFKTGGTNFSPVIQTSIQITGGSSGSPVYNLNSKVVGLNYGYDSDTNFILYIDLVADALKQLKQGKIPNRGDIGTSPYLFKTADLVSHSSKTKNILTESNSLLTVGALTVNSAAEGKIETGDIILKVNDKLIGDNIYLFDKIIDDNVNKKVKLTVYRGEQTLEYELPVSDLNEDKTIKFTKYAGAIFQNISKDLRRKYCYKGTGVFLNYTDFSVLNIGKKRGSQNDLGGLKTVILTQLGSKRISNLDDFIEAVTILKSNKVFIKFVDLDSVYTIEDWDILNINSMYDPLAVYELKDNEWTKLETVK